ncbi:restriction endonuclease subunit S [Adlercreutzia aquisgranensis]|uniref:restriction endonuclease subunit S n=1 Tax=Adlercreutzia aquisgranensis TaxID=2941323 RepID=UPI00203B7C47|nr:restriction endonuclease subunit S [Adlercreutzia aquisgranensis]
MECRVRLGDVVKVVKRGVKPEPGIVYRHYSLPAFDNGMRPEKVDGDTIRSSKLVVFPNTILMNKLNVRFKRVWPVLECNDRSIASTEFMPLKVEGADYWYIYYYLISPALTSLIEGMRTGTSGSHQRIDASSFLGIQIDLPSLKNQEAIGRILRAFDEKIELNNRINDYLAAVCDSVAESLGVDGSSVLSDMCSQTSAKIACSAASPESYVSTESLLPNKGGRQLASSLPTTGKVTSYQAGDTLVSNIRPYFKKIWYADREGTCSGDVIVFRANEPDFAPYLYSILRSDSFFEHVMAGSKGTKMPRGDKGQMMRYPVSCNCGEEILKTLASILDQISLNNRESARMTALRDSLLPKLMSGEIDVSQIDLTQLNNRLSDC